jgi:hemerythrin
MAAIGHIPPVEGHCVSVKSTCLLNRVVVCTRELNRSTELQEKYEHLDRFVSFIFSHFSEEEGEMNTHLYPNLQAHQEDHILCCCAVVNKFRDVRRGLCTIEQLNSFLLQKVYSRISTFDSDYHRFLSINNFL